MLEYTVVDRWNELGENMVIANSVGAFKINLRFNRILEWPLWLLDCR